jgi:hypothetical protein
MGLDEIGDRAVLELIKHFYRHVVPTVYDALKDTALEAEAWDAGAACVGWGQEVELWGALDDPHGTGIVPRKLKDWCDAELAKIAKKRFGLAYDRCLRGQNEWVQLLTMLGHVRVLQLVSGEDIDKILGPDWSAKVNRCRDEVGMVFAGTIGWTERSDASDGGSSAHETRTAQIQVAFQRERGTDRWEGLGGSYSMSSSVNNVSTCPSQPSNQIFREEKSASGVINPEPHMSGYAWAYLVLYMPGRGLSTGPPEGHAFVNALFSRPKPAGFARDKNCDGSTSQRPPSSLSMNTPDCPPRKPGESTVKRPPGLRGLLQPGGRALEFGCTLHDVHGARPREIKVHGTLQRRD